MRLMTLCARQLVLPYHLSDASLPFAVQLKNIISKVSVREAGHSHWSNIRHIKGANDKLKSDYAKKTSMLIRLAVKESGGGDVKLNRTLANIVREASRNNVPSKSIDTMIKSAVASKDSTQRVFFEARGPSGSFFIFDIITDNVGQVRNHLNRQLLKYCGGSVLERGATNHYFSKKGFVEVIVLANHKLTLMEAEDIAITVDAEEVELVKQEEESDEQRYRFICSADDLHTVAQKLSQNDSLEMVSSESAFVPIVFASLSDEEKNSVFAAFEQVKKLVGFSVEAISDNIE